MNLLVNVNVQPCLHPQVCTLMDGCTLILSWLNLINGRPLGILRTAFIWPLSSYAHCNSIGCSAPHCREEARWLSLSIHWTRRFRQNNYAKLHFCNKNERQKNLERICQNGISKPLKIQLEADVCFGECYACIHSNHYFKVFSAKTAKTTKAHLGGTSEGSKKPSKWYWMKWTTNWAACSTPVQHVIHLKASLI